MICISPWPRAGFCWRTSASSYKKLTWRCSIREVRGGPPSCRWRRYPCAATRTRRGCRGYWRSAAGGPRPGRRRLLHLRGSRPAAARTGPVHARHLRPDRGADRGRVRCRHRTAGCGRAAARPRCRSLFLVALDDEGTSFRYHRLVRQVLHAELRAGTAPVSRRSSRGRLSGSKRPGDGRRAAHFYLAAGRADRALELLQAQVVPDFLHVPTTPVPLALGVGRPLDAGRDPGTLPRPDRRAAVGRRYGSRR